MRIRELANDKVRRVLTPPSSWCSLRPIFVFIVMAPSVAFCLIGAEWNPTGNPIGGGPGYSDSVRHQDADYYVTNKTELLSALASASWGDIIYVSDTVEIDLSTEVPQILIPGGVTLASGRGRTLDDTISWGGLLYTTRHDVPLSLFRTYGDNVRVTGLRLRGADPDIGQLCDPMVYQFLRAVSIYDEDCEVDNCEIYEWGYAGVVAGDGAINAHVHHNYIHHNRRRGCGYGVVTGDDAEVLIEANLFDFYRHAVAASPETTNCYEARYNISLEHDVDWQCFDRHGTGGNPNYGGKRTIIHHNTFWHADDKGVAINGMPCDTAKIYNNWFYHSDSASAIQLYTNTNCNVFDNHYSTSPPPGAADRLPVAVANASIDSGAVPLTVSFIGANSYDSDGHIAWCEWDFGDGTTLRKPIADHTFEEIGIYNAQLTVYDNTGIPDRDIIPIIVAPAASDSHYLSFWVKDSYRSGARPGYFFLQAYIDTCMIWQQDVVGDSGWIHVVSNVTDQVIGKDSVTIELKLYCNSNIDASQYTELVSYWDDIALFWAQIKNGDFEAHSRGYNQNPQHWTWSYYGPTGGYWGCESGSGDVRSGKQSFWLSMTNSGLNKAGDWIQLEQKVAVGCLGLSRSNEESSMIYAIYPNPSLNTALFTYQTRTSNDISLKVYDTNGRLVKMLIDEKQEAGFYQFDWDGSDVNGRKVANGVYFCKFVAEPIGGGDKYSDTKKIVFLR